MDMIRLLVNEMRRALHRRVVWVLLLLAFVGIALLGVIAFTDSAGRTVTELHADGAHPAVMADWWVGGGGDGILMIAALPLVLGALFGGASVVGAEWRAGTVTTVLTWEPRRLRLHVARTAACAILATGIAFALEILFLAATLPAVVAHGTTDGTDAAWWGGLLAAMVRLALLAGAGAALTASLATLGRSTAFALTVVFAWLAIGENLVRGLKPSLQPLLLGDNLSIVLTWAQLESASFTRSEGLALVTVLGYLALAAVLAAASFVRRDIAGAG
jgi:hypothetical protein